MDLPDTQSIADSLLARIREKKFESTDSVKVWAEKTLLIANRLKDKSLIADVFTELAWMNRMLGNNAQALEDADVALQHAEELKDPERQASALYEIGTVQQDLGHFANAIQSFQEAREKFEQQGDLKGVGKSINAMGEVHRKQGEFHEAHKNYLEARRYFAKIGFDNGLNMITNNIGLIYAAMGDCQKAIDTLWAAVDQAHRLSFHLVVMESSEQIAKCEMELGNLNAAEETARYVLQIATEKHYLVYARDAAHTLMQVSQRKGDYESAFKYQKMHFDFSSELLNEATQNRISSLNYSMNLRAKETEIEVLNRDRKINSLITTMAVSGLAVFLLFAIALVIFYQRIRKDNRLLATQNDALGELNREKDSLINIVAHDLKSPISKTKGLLRMLGTLHAFSDQQQKVAGMMEKTLDDGERLIRDLLDISYAEGSSSHFKADAFELVHLVKSLVDVQAEAAKRKEIELSFHSAFPTLEMFSDDSFVSRILDNLLSNAVKYSPNGSKVVVELGKEGQEAWFSVQDQGPGFTPEDKEKMFRKFQKLSARPTGGESSNGLGLAIIQMLSQKLGGKVSLETEPGAGSKFTVSFPVDCRK